jgi:hypothetical protein
MGLGRREKDIKLLVAKFIKLVESLNPGERLSIKKVAAKRRPAAKGQNAAAKAGRGTLDKPAGKAARKGPGKRTEAARKTPRTKASG